MKGKYKEMESRSGQAGTKKWISAT
jgi:hypothetical protein